MLGRHPQRRVQRLIVRRDIGKPAAFASRLAATASIAVDWIVSKGLEPCRLDATGSGKPVGEEFGMERFEVTAAALTIPAAAPVTINDGFAFANGQHHKIKRTCECDERAFDGHRVIKAI